MDAWLWLGIVMALVILIHELGHFLALRWQGVPVKEVAIGFGPVLVKRTWGNTQYSVRLIWLGGAVHIEDRVWAEAGPRKRIIALLAGPAMNIVGMILSLLLAGWGSREILAIASDLGVNGAKLLADLTYTIPTLQWQQMMPEQNFNLLELWQDGYVQQGMSFVWLFSAVMHYGVAIFNLVPLPPLDGGNIAMEILRRVLPQKLFNATIRLRFGWGERRWESTFSPLAIVYAAMGATVVAFVVWSWWVIL